MLRSFVGGVTSRAHADAESERLLWPPFASQPELREKNLRFVPAAGGFSAQLQRSALGTEPKTISIC